MARKRSRPRRPNDYREVVKKIRGVNEFEPESNTALYGKAGTGKTTLACTWPKPIILLDFKEKGTDSVRDVKDLDVIRIEDFLEVESIYWYIKDNLKKYKTCIWDTVSQGQDLCISSYLIEKGKEVEEIGKWGTMTKRDWGSVSSKMKEWVTNYKELPLNMVFVAHDRVFNIDEDDDDEEGRLLPEVGPRLMPSVASTLNGSVSIIANTFIRERYEKVKVKKKRYKEIRHVDYCLRVGPHAIYTTKIRKPKKIILPDVIVDPNHEKLMKYVEGEEDVKEVKTRQEGKISKNKLQGSRNKKALPRRRLSLSR